jgi:PTH1 family peptidyl-tRNA hydrolase
MADLLTDHWEFPPFRREGAAAVSVGTCAGSDLTVVKPRTYMNRSGRALAGLIGQAGFEPARDLLVMVDDFALPGGTFRVRARGSAGGHNGLRSVQDALGTTEYARLRLGVGPLPSGIGDTAGYVLEPFPKTELDELLDIAPDVRDAIECWVAEGIETAMNQFNRRGVDE